MQYGSCLKVKYSSREHNEVIDFPRSLGTFTLLEQNLPLHLVVYTNSFCFVPKDRYPHTKGHRTDLISTATRFKSKPFSVFQQIAPRLQLVCILQPFVFKKIL
jgi:hypothetical protein